MTPLREAYEVVRKSLAENLPGTPEFRVATAALAAFFIHELDTTPLEEEWLKKNNWVQHASTWNKDRVTVYRWSSTLWAVVGCIPMIHTVGELNTLIRMDQEAWLRNTQS